MAPDASVFLGPCVDTDNGLPLAIRISTVALREEKVPFVFILRVSPSTLFIDLETYQISTS